MEKAELYNILMSDDVVNSINKNVEQILNLIPELNSIINFEHRHPHHHLDVWQHTLLALSISPREFDIRVALLLHDIGKPYSYQDGEIRHFKGHPYISSKMAFNILKRLNFNLDEVSLLCYLIEQHDTPITEEEIIQNRDLSIKKFKIQCCDGLAHNPSKLQKRILYLLSINEKLNNGLEKEKYKILINSYIYK